MVGGGWLFGPPTVSLPFPLSPSLNILLLRFQSMGSSNRRSLHQILGGGFIAEVILWRRRDVTVRVLIGTIGFWLLFQVFGYTVLGLLSKVLLLLISILFVWAKAAAVINRPPPPIPNLHLSEEIISEVVTSVHSHVNLVLSAFHSIALGKDSKLFYKVATCLWLISVFSSWVDLLTFGCTSLVILLTVPALYEKYEDAIYRYAVVAYMEIRQYERLPTYCASKVEQWIIEKKMKSS